MFTPKGLSVRVRCPLFMKILTNRDEYKRLLFKKKEFNILFYLIFYCNKKIKHFFKKELPFKKVFVRAKLENLCIVTGNKKGVYSKYRVSRFVIKGLGLAGFLPGLRQSS